MVFVVAALFVVGGIALMAPSLRATRRDTAFDGVAQRSRAVVTGIRTFSGGGGSRVARAQLRFAIGPRVIDTEAPAGMAPPQEGEIVPILYDLRDPTQVRIGYSTGGPSLAWVGVAFGFTFTFLGFLVAIVAALL